MGETRIDMEYVRRRRIHLLILAALTLVLVVSGRSGYRVAQIIGLAVFLVDVLIVLICVYGGPMRYHCPKCRRRIAKPTNWPLHPGDRILYYCNWCRITWDLKSRAPSSGVDELDT